MDTALRLITLVVCFAIWLLIVRRIGFLPFLFSLVLLASVYVALGGG